MAKEAILKIKNIEKKNEGLIEMEKERLKLKIKNVKIKAAKNVEKAKEDNTKFYNEFVIEFQNQIDQRAEEFKKKVEADCLELETKLKKNISKAVDLILSNFLQS